MELVNLTDLLAESGFGVFSRAAKAGGQIQAIVRRRAAPTTPPPGSTS